MTVSTSDNVKDFAGDDSTVAFDYPYAFFNTTELVVYVIDSVGAETLQTETTDYSVSGGSGSTGTVTMVTAPATGETLRIQRVLPITQGIDAVNGNTNDAEVMEASLDKLTMMIQQVNELANRALRISAFDLRDGADMVFPDAATRASRFPVFDANGVMVSPPFKLLGYGD